MEKIIRLVATNDRGMRIGETHHRAKYPDALVDKVRDMHEEQGMGYGAIAQALNLSKSIVREWCRYSKRAQTCEGWKRVVVEPQGALTEEVITED